MNTKKFKILGCLVIVLFINVICYLYFSKNDFNKNNNILAVNYNHSDYRAIFDYNGGELSGFDNEYFDKLTNGLYGLKNSAGDNIIVNDVNRSKKGDHYLMFWSLDYKCTTKDLQVGSEGTVNNHKVYYACYEEKNFDKGGVRYVQEGAFVSGDYVSCGDALYVTKCYEKSPIFGEEQYCEFEQVKYSGKNKFSSGSGIVYRKRLSTDKVNNCKKQVTVYYHEKDLDCAKTNNLENGVCAMTVEEGKKAYTPNTSGLKNGNNKFIGWAADDDGVNVNCSGKLLTSEKVTINSDVHYYACYEQPKKTCNNSAKITNGVSETYTINVCYNAKVSSDGQISVTPVSDDYNTILQCAENYKLDEISTTNIVENTCTEEGLCNKKYQLKCVSTDRPKITATSVLANEKGYGSIIFSGTSTVGVKGFYASNIYKKPTVNSTWVMNSQSTYSIDSDPGTVFLWVIDNNNVISYAAMASVIDRVNVDTTLETLQLKSEDGKNLNPSVYSYDNYVGESEISSSDYVLLSNRVLSDSKILASGFNPFDTAYKVTTSSEKIAVYATLTSKDAKYVEGYEPRTVDLDYGVNTILIKIQNKKGNVRTYTIIATREDDRDSSNLLKSISLSKGKLDFDSYKTDYVVNVSKNLDSVSINGELFSKNASFVDGYGPRKIELKNDSTTASIKVKSESGSVRAYTITFIKNSDVENVSDESYLSSLSLSNAYIAFDKEVFEYNTSVDYEIDAIDIYALSQNGGDSVTLIRTNNGLSETINNKNIPLNIGDNNILIVVSNDEGVIKTYSVNIIRKENGLDVSSDTKLNMLSVDGYDIKFSPEKADYEIKIKREKSLVIAATPMSNRANIYIRGNEELTGFSIVRIKVVSEDGRFKEYTIDIKKDTYNKTVEIIGLVSGVIIIICGIIVIRVKKRRKSINDYYA